MNSGKVVCFARRQTRWHFQLEISRRVAFDLERRQTSNSIWRRENTSNDVNNVIVDIGIVVVDDVDATIWCELKCLAPKHLSEKSFY